MSKLKKSFRFKKCELTPFHTLNENDAVTRCDINHTRTQKKHWDDAETLGSRKHSDIHTQNTIKISATRSKT